ncbi:cyclin domain protein, partial [Oesophagostomum dentatum]
FSESEDGEEENSSFEYNEELENDVFRELEAGLNDHRYQTKEAPPQLTALRCTGIGSPKKVWGLLCRKNELIRPSHRLLDNHPELVPRTRAILVDWMMEVCGHEKQHRETFHLAVDYVDRFLGTFHGIRSQNFQLVGTAALFLASKYEVICSEFSQVLVTYYCATFQQGKVIIK